MNSKEKDAGITKNKKATNIEQDIVGQEKREVFLTGDRPSGRLHLGHYVGSLENRIKIQQFIAAKKDGRLGIGKEYFAVTNNIIDKGFTFTDKEDRGDKEDKGFTCNTNVITRSIGADGSSSEGDEGMVSSSEVSALCYTASEIRWYQYIMIADVQALTDNYDKPDKIHSSVLDIARDYAAVGISLVENTVFIQSQIPELAELTLYFMNLVQLGRLERNPTLKNEIRQKKMANSLSPGFLCYPISQAADITAFKATKVPVGVDQLPMIEQTNEIVRKFNKIYNTNCLKESSAIVGEVKKLVGIDGSQKASKSLNNAIYLSDSPREIQKKVMSMFTDPNHIKITDPGKVEGNPVFAYLDAFCKSKNDLETLQGMKKHYTKGGLGDVEIKKFLNSVLQDFIEPIAERYQKLNNQDIMEMLHEGTKQARKVAQDTLREVREVMKINYF